MLQKLMFLIVFTAPLLVKGETVSARTRCTSQSYVQESFLKYLSFSHFNLLIL